MDKEEIKMCNDYFTIVEKNGRKILINNYNDFCILDRSQNIDDYECGSSWTGEIVRTIKDRRGEFVNIVRLLSPYILIEVIDENKYVVKNGNNIETYLIPDEVKDYINEAWDIIDKKERIAKCGSNITIYDTIAHGIDNIINLYKTLKMVHFDTVEEAVQYVKKKYGKDFESFINEHKNFIDECGISICNNDGSYNVNKICYFFICYRINKLTNLYFRFVKKFKVYPFNKDFIF